MGDLSPNFSRKEFECKCGCGFNDIDPKIVEICQKVRDAVGSAIRINSACRCTAHNKNVGGVQRSTPKRGGRGIAGDSFHTFGQAADLSSDTIGARGIYVALWDLYQAGSIPELKYALLYKDRNFVHVDVGTTRKAVFEEQ